MRAFKTLTSEWIFGCGRGHTKYLQNKDNTLKIWPC